tara:strand:+ start:644 stop:1069 length:426 start_codon:yes stop_codon:yes gene_type:complete
MMQLIGISSKEINLYWEHCKDFIELGNDQSQEELTLQDIKESCINAEMQLWVVVNERNEVTAAVTTQIIEYPNKKVCRIVTLGGVGLDKWLHLLDEIEEWARYMRCQAVEMFCRKGFLKKLQEKDYKQIYVVLGKKIETKH